jgi:hypothetical protein
MFTLTFSKASREHAVVVAPVALGARPWTAFR